MRSVSKQTARDRGPFVVHWSPGGGLRSAVLVFLQFRLERDVRRRPRGRFLVLHVRIGDAAAAAELQQRHHAAQLLRVPGIGMLTSRMFLRTHSASRVSFGTQYLSKRRGLVIVRRALAARCRRDRGLAMSCSIVPGGDATAWRRRAHPRQVRRAIGIEQPGLLAGVAAGTIAGRAPQSSPRCGVGHAPGLAAGVGAAARSRRAAGWVPLRAADAGFGAGAAFCAAAVDAGAELGAVAAAVEGVAGALAASAKAAVRATEPRSGACAGARARLAPAPRPARGCHCGSGCDDLDLGRLPCAIAARFA